jgi:hypothetical protein
MERHGQRFQLGKMMATQTWSVLIKENVIAILVLVCALKVMTEWHVKEQSALTIAQDVGSVSLKRLLLLMLQQLTKLHGMLKSTLVANVILVTVAPTAL